MINRNRIGFNDVLLDHSRGNAAKKVRVPLEILLQRGSDLDMENCESVQEWINMVFEELRPFPSEHRTFRLHCVHIGLALLTISMEKSEQMKLLSH